MFNTLNSIVKNEKIHVVLAAVIAGILFVGRHITTGLYQIKQGAPFNFFTFHHPDPLTNLAPMFRQVMDGAWYVTDGRVLENVGDPSLWSFVSPIVGYPFLALTQDVSLQFLIGTICTATLVFIISYAIAKHLTRSHWWSMVYSFLFVNATLVVLFVLPIDLVGLKTLIRSITFMGSPPQEILMSRYVSVSVFPTWPVFVFSVLALLKVAATPQSKKWVWFAALSSGMLTLMYVTDAMYIFGSIALMIIWFFLQTDTKRAKAFASVLGIATLTSMPYIVNYLSIQALPHAQELVERLGAEFTHSFRFNAWPQYAVMIVLAYGVWQWGKRENRTPAATVLGSMLLSGIFILNMQVVLGFNPHPQVWPVHQFYLGYAFALLVIAHLFITHLIKPKFLNRSAITLLTVATLLIGARGVQTEFLSGIPLREASIIPQDIQTSLQWINNNIPANKVIASPSATTNSLIPALTSAHSIQPLAVTSATPLSEVVDRWLTINKLYDIPNATLVKSLKKEHMEIDAFAGASENATAIFLFDTYFWKKGLGAFDEGRQLSIPQDAIDTILAAYDDLPEDDILLDKYAMDYVYVGPYERALGIQNMDELSYTQNVFNENDIQIYKIIKEELTL